VLIIEDDAELRRLTVALLEEGELETIECESAAAPTRMVSPAGLAPTSGDIVTQIQLGGSRTDSLVRILHAQPRSRLKPEVRKRKTPSRGLRSASHSWPYACAGGPRPPVPPLLGGRSFTIGPFYATPELLIGFAAAVACTIALRFMLQATYLTFCRPSL
jgi:CheY-like chemotaxis protein